MRKYLPPRVLWGIAGFLAALVIVGGLALYRLDRRIVDQFEGRRWDLPAQVYARPLEIYTGLRLSADDLEAELTRLGYTRAPTAKAQGTFSRDRDRIALMTRPFQFWDGSQASQKAIVAFAGGSVGSLRDGAARDLPLLRLDPPFIGNIFTIHGEDRVIVAPAEVPPLLLQGLKAVEDRDFETHAGVSFRGIARAMLANLRAGRMEQGASTLTQQLVRSYFLSNERTLRRKLREAVMSVLLELHFEKADILNAYVNEIYLGQAGERAIHGFGLASQFYFGRPLTELDVPEVALLIAIVRGPSLYDPRRNPDTARKRRDLVLGIMADNGLITPEQAAKARETRLRVRGSAATFASYNPTFMDLVRRELRADFNEADLQTTGLRVLTTLDPRVQEIAEAQLGEGLAALERDKKLKSGTLDGAIVVTNALTPDVAAVVGGRNARLRGFNRALDARRPIGSLVKPFVYLAGFESGRYTAASILEDAPLDIRLDSGKRWQPENYDRQYRGPVPAVRALAESLNTPTVRLGMDIGPRKVARLMKNLGLEAPPRPVPALLLGAVSLTPLEVTQLYSSLANGGFRTPLRTVRAVLDADGKPLDRDELKIERGADPVAVAELNASLVQVIERGTARAARRWLPADTTVAGKTGTSNDTRDSWFAGFTNDHLAIVWVGADDNRSTGLTGATGALPIWSRMMAKLGGQGFEILPAEGLELMEFDYFTGMSADASCGDIVQLPLPAGTALLRKPECGTTPGEILNQGIEQGLEWLRGVLN